MGVLDKIKNALFEVEYVEVEEKPRKEKKSKSSETVREEVEEEKPIAKKIVLPGRKEEKVEEIEEEDLKDEDFEVRPKDEKVKEVFQDNFNVMGDDDYVPDVPPKMEIPQPVVTPDPVPETIPSRVVLPGVPQTQPETIPIYQEPTYADKDYVREYDSYKEKVYSSIQDAHHVKQRESRPYGMDPSYQVSIKEYGSEGKDEKTYFRPSPIISPIYGILDKNYKKEDVVSKKEIRITSSYTRSNMNVDDIRNKAYGNKLVEEVKEEVVPQNTFDVEEEDENLLVDLSDEKKPEVKEITVGDAMEYFHDLGLEYNVDYVDASNRNVPKRKPDDLEEDIKDTMSRSEEVEEEATPAVPVPVVERREVNENRPVVEVVDETNEEQASTLDDDDNLFDLIDSMYREEDN